MKKPIDEATYRRRRDIWIGVTNVIFTISPAVLQVDRLLHPDSELSSPLAPFWLMLMFTWCLLPFAWLFATFYWIRRKNWCTFGYNVLSFVLGMSFFR
ncbi:MAG: hypothetical protein JST35_06510 [Armatimonadetes bacterium]|nr:hypothetical protein [Armatimonadota bacterium]